MYIFPSRFDGRWRPPSFQLPRDADGWRDAEEQHLQDDGGCTEKQNNSKEEATGHRTDGKLVLYNLSNLKVTRLRMTHLKYIMKLRLNLEF